MSLKLSTVNNPETRRRLEAALRGESSLPVKRPALFVKAALKRLRQQEQPLLNGLETAWMENLKRTLPAESLSTLRGQAIRFRIANGVAYTPDFTAMVGGKPFAWECKGPRKVRWSAKGAMTTKMAAQQYPEWTWIYVWKEDGEWRTQIVLP